MWIGGHSQQNERIHRLPQKETQCFSGKSTLLGGRTVVLQKEAIRNYLLSTRIVFHQQRRMKTRRMFRNARRSFTVRRTQTAIVLVVVLLCPVTVTTATGSMIRQYSILDTYNNCRFTPLHRVYQKSLHRYYNLSLSSSFGPTGCKGCGPEMHTCHQQDNDSASNRSFTTVLDMNAVVFASDVELVTSEYNTIHKIVL